ncbi:DUF1707 domain-containing protein [Saccharopolyspora halophila]|uniref:DUF1707 domain-containing protein n=1 Tax=Saccharopolyspora halophila TaxID=405551 RepID=A0ABP5SNL3_9PSEU
MAEPNDETMRASDHDREQVAERLRGALEEGRLNLGEYDERLRQAYAAATLGELAQLTSDLPVPRSAAEVAERDEKKAARREKQLKEWRSWASVSFILVAIWLVTSIASGEPIFFWPAIPMGIWAAINVADMISGSGDCGRAD